MDERDRLLAQSDIMLAHAKHLNKKIKDLMKELAIEKEFRNWGFFYGEESRIEAELGLKIDFLIEEKISVEKFGKKLRHQANEL